MEQPRSSTVSRLRLTFAFLGCAFAPFLASACDDINRPAHVPRSQVRTECFSDVECPSNKKCLKGPNDVQGVCTSTDGGPGAEPTPGQGTPGSTLAPVPAPVPTPSPTPHPGDVQL